MPGASPGLPAMEYEMYAASTGIIIAKPAAPMAPTFFRNGFVTTMPCPAVASPPASDSARKIPPTTMTGIM